MRTNKRIPNLQAKVPLAKQCARIRALFPHWEVSLKNSTLTAIGDITPQPLSDTYSVKITYNAIIDPMVSVISPNLLLIPGAAKLPHVYPGDKLCLHYPGYHEWTKKMYIADKIIPWISLWLFYYELWHATEEWQGGGIHPKVPTILGDG